MKLCKAALCFGYLSTLIFIAGCGQDGVEGRPKLYPASGVVTYQGKPVAGATVTFFPENQQLPSASAKTNANGKYVLQTFEADDGVVAGPHKVSIMKWEIEAFQVNEDEGDANFKPAPPPKALVPANYANPGTSKLQATVEESRSNTFDFDLK
jgi:hypothetical protein